MTYIILLALLLGFPALVFALLVSYKLLMLFAMTWLYALGTVAKWFKLDDTKLGDAYARAAQRLLR